MSAQLGTSMSITRNTGLSAVMGLDRPPMRARIMIASPSAAEALASATETASPAGAPVRTQAAVEEVSALPVVVSSLLLHPAMVMSAAAQEAAESRAMVLRVRCMVDSFCVKLIVRGYRAAARGISEI